MSIKNNSHSQVISFFITIILLYSYMPLNVVSIPLTINDQLNSSDSREIVMKIEKINEQLPGNLRVK